MKRSLLSNTVRMLAFFAASSALLLTFAPVDNADARVDGFDPGMIISDSTMKNANSMNGGQIQTFLNAKGSNCSNNCLKNYSQNGKSAADIINDAGKEYGINPQVLIVLIQKESGLVTINNPSDSRYRTATGYGCPDSSGCDANYYGFTNQVRNSARMFSSIVNRNPNWYSPYVVGNNRVYYHPGPFTDGQKKDINYCGSSTVNIRSWATAALYSYTPYQPNDASLNADYGTGDACSSYGNRNFFLYFRDWFGSLTGTGWGWAMTSYAVYSDSGYTNQINEGPVVNLAAGQTAYVRVNARNSEFNTWSNALMIGTTNTNPVLKNNSWLSNDRAARLSQSSVAYDQTGNFNFSVTAPNQPGTYFQNFNLVLDGVTWFNSAGPTIQFNTTNPISEPPLTDANKLASGAELTSGKSIFSPDKKSVLRFENGRLNLFVNFKKVWSASVSNTQGTKLVNQSDGNLVIYTASGQVTWASNTAGGGASTLNMQNDGNLVLYPSSGSPWATNSASSNQLVRVNNRLNGNYSVLAGQEMTTPNRNYHLVMQGDGNLVLYRSNGSVVWASNTPNSGASYLTMQEDGNLVLYTASGQAVWNSHTNGRGLSSFQLQDDVNLVVYAGAGPTWASNTSGRY